MIVSRKVTSHLAIITLLSVLANYAHAQQNDPTSAPFHPPTNSNPEWQSKLEERTERREFREEAQTLRTEHEELESEHDRLLSRCMDAKGQDRTACHAQSEDLKARQEALHERVKNLHDKMQAEHQHGMIGHGMPPGEPGQWRVNHEMVQPGTGPAPLAPPPPNHMSPPPPAINP